MRSWMAAAVAAMAWGAASAPAQDACDLVRQDYAVYLHRAACEHEVQGWVCNLRHGMSPEDLRCNFLGSDEYYLLHGGTPEGFVTGLYEDVLGREPRCDEVHCWLHQTCRCHDRVKIAHGFVCAAQTELAMRAAAPPVYAPPPTYDPPPVPIPPAGYVPRHDDGPRVSIRIGLGR